jgi:hypothetical protein
LKNSASSHKDFSKFKGEFFAINEPIINKDLVQLSLPVVKL